MFSEVEILKTFQIYVAISAKTLSTSQIHKGLSHTIAFLAMHAHMLVYTYM